MFKKTLTSLILTLVAFGGFFGVSINHDTEKLIVSGISETYAEFIDCGNGTRSNSDGVCPQSASTNTENQYVREFYDKFVALINIFITIMAAIIGPAVIMAGWLISPDWTSGDLFNLRPIIHDLWVTVSNIVYFIYAILLIVIALATIFNSDHYGYKAMLPKLALGIIMVPLTWWMVQFTISLATYVTASVITIPHATFMKFQEKCNGQSCWVNNPIIPKEYIFSSKESDIKDSTLVKCSLEDGKDTGKCISPNDFMKESGGTYGQMLVYAYGVFRVGELKQLPTGAVNGVASIVQIIHSGLINIILFIIFGVLVLALVVMLLMRAVKLWFYAIFSPLFTLHFVTGGALFGGDNKESFSIKEFLGLAFVPAVVGLSLSFGLVIVGAIQSASPTKSESCDKDKIMANAEGVGGCQIVGLFGNDNNKIIRKIVPDGNNKYYTQNDFVWGSVVLKFKGDMINISAGDSIDKAATREAEGTNGAGSVLTTGGGMLGTLIIDIIAMVFIWVAFMAAKGVSKAVAAAVEPFEKMGQQIGKLGMSLPKYAPLPLPGGSIRGMEKSVDLAASIPEHKFNESYAKNGIGKKLTEMAGGASPGDMAKLNQANSQISPKEVVAQWKSAMHDMQNRGEAIKVANDVNKEHLIKLAEKKLSSDEFKMSYSLDVAKKLAELLNDPKNMESESNRLIASALLAGARLNEADNAAEAKKFLENRKNSEQSVGNTNTGNLKITVNTANNNFKIGDNQVDAKLSDDASKITEALEKNSKLTGIMTKEEFESVLKETEYFQDKNNTDKLKSILGSLESNGRFFKKR